MAGSQALRRLAPAACVAFALVVAAVACDEDPPPDPHAPKPKTSAPSPCSTSAPPSYCDAGVLPEAGASCRFGVADGVCQPPEEGCDCEDCRTSALCTMRCKDDETCDLAEGGEDCTCGDCRNKTAACSPKSVGCLDDGVCDPAHDDCTCKDCAASPACACSDNDECVERLESCACADCQDVPACQ